MIKAEADLAQQRMLIVADQAMKCEELESLIEQIKHEAVKLQPGWVAAIDLRGMWIEDLFFCEQAQNLQSTIIESGAGKIGTIIDSSSIQMFLGQAGIKTHSNEVTQRFFNEASWKLFLEE
jgi:hypothetical protein